MIWEKSLDDFKPIELLFNENKKHFIILSENALYIFSTDEQQLMKKYDGNNLTSMALAGENNHIVVGTEDGILSLDSESLEV